MKRIFCLFYIIVSFIQVVSSQSDTIYAFTHPKFFYSEQCECSRFDFDYIYLSLYDTNAKPISRMIIPANFDVGHQVTIIEKKGDFFKVKFYKIAPEDYEQDLDGKMFCVERGDLGTWLYKYDEKTDSYVDVPLYENPSYNSKIVSYVYGVAIILDINENWMYIETIGKNRGQRGWLAPINQCGCAYGGL